MRLDVTIRPAELADAAAISDVIQKALRESNSKDYPEIVIERLTQGAGPTIIETFIKSRDMFVAECDQRVIGTASLDNNVVRTVFVEPRSQRHGAGRLLMSKIEEIARMAACPLLSVPSSITAVSFYEKLGFHKVREEFFDEEKTIIMERALSTP